ncbi:hypothetical protein Golob_004203 [Gossypium lobatum]|uniref:Pentatricopeptide repeat-containing protein n=1 Tax=Gossypium lobatum TaxID=34289 RepID=A0A7J8N0V8_9ROSI|nr:hypothetical protein [Gossypium lobatum]
METLRSLINALYKENRNEEAISMLELMSQRNVIPDIVTYCFLILGLWSLGSCAEVASLFSRMLNGAQPDVETLSSLINALCKEKKIEEAITLYKLMIQRDLKPDIVTYSCLIHGSCNSGQCGEATSLLSKMVAEEIVPDVETFNICWMLSANKEQ